MLEAVASRFGHEFRFESHLIGGAAIDATQSALPASDRVGVRHRGCRAAGRRRRTEMVRSEREGPARAGSARPAQGARPVCERAPGFAASGAARCFADQARSAARHRHRRGARADRRYLLRREDTHSGHASDLCTYSVEEIQRVTRVAGRSRAADASRSCRSTRRTCSRRRACGAATVEQVLREEFPDVNLEHMLVDSAAMHLIRKPRAST